MESDRVDYDQEFDDDDDDDDEEEEMEVYRGKRIEDVNHNDTKPGIGFLDIHMSNNGSSSQISPERSPSSSTKGCVPPLDLSILHEHGDGSGRILILICITRVVL